jgi:hypothetical protein
MNLVGFLVQDVGHTSKLEEASISFGNDKQFDQQ